MIPSSKHQSVQELYEIGLFFLASSCLLQDAMLTALGTVNTSKGAPSPRNVFSRIEHVVGFCNAVLWGDDGSKKDEDNKETEDQETEDKETVAEAPEVAAAAAECEDVEEHGEEELAEEDVEAQDVD